MTIALVVVFLVFFVGGPLIFRALTNQDPSPHWMRGLAFLSATLVMTGLFIRFAMPHQWGQNLWVTAFGILLIWCAWIGVLGFVTLALRQNDPSTRMRRWTAIVGALCTTVPWFGLASANMLQG